MPTALAPLFQMLSCMFVLAVALLVPGQNADLVLIPLGSRSAAVAVERDGPALRLIGPGRIAGSLVAHADGPVPVLALLRQGIVPLAAPANPCGGTSAPVSSGARQPRS